MDAILHRFNIFTEQQGTVLKACLERWTPRIDFYNPREYAPRRLFTNLMTPISKDEWKLALQAIPMGKAPGASGILGIFLRKLPENVSEVLRMMCTVCLQQEDIPESWKVAVLCPIPKTTSWTGDLATTRPIALLETVRKLIERVYTRRLQTILERNHLLKGWNMGFQRGLRTQNPNHALLQIEGVKSKQEVPFYLGKRVVYIYKARRAIKGTNDVKATHYRSIWGRIARAHGSNGVVRAHFRSNLPPQAMGACIRVMLFPSRV